jgi:hypothetical protein
MVKFRRKPNVSFNTEFQIMYVSHFCTKNTFLLVFSLPKYSYLLPPKFHFATAVFLKSGMIYVPVKSIVTSVTIH